MEDPKIEERKNFMKRKTFTYSWWCYLTIISIATYTDPLKKREEFAVSLRKKKTSDIINAKRRKIISGMPSDVTADMEPSEYHGFKQFEQNKDEYNQLLMTLCP